MEQWMIERSNAVLLRGSALEQPAISHENHGKVFYRFPLEIERLSGTCDIVQVVAEEQLLRELELEPGDVVEVQGQMRSFNNRSGQGRRLVITVLAEKLHFSAREPENQVFLQGVLCRDPVYRRTPLGREITDVMLAVDRPYGRRDYMPCILWGSLARMASGCRKGERLWLWGRLQSRIYVKQTESGGEERTAYEISAITAGLDDPEAP